jgi:hypothetical protein
VTPAYPCQLAVADPAAHEQAVATAESIGADWAVDGAGDHPVALGHGQNVADAAVL